MTPSRPRLEGPRPGGPLGDGADDLIRPLDEHNLRHLKNVHPPGYVGPKPKDRYHLVVIGAGPGGLVTAAAGAALGARVALIERRLMGGDCLNVGCVPSKAILRAARAWHETITGAERFGAPPAAGVGDFAAAMRRMRRLRSDLGRVDSVERYREMGVDVFLGEGRFVDPETVEVGGERLNFRRAVIATGARAALPPVPGIEEAGPLTNETIFWLETLPKRLLVIGAGPVGCELAQAFARFGSQVTVVNRGTRLLPREDVDAAAILEASMKRDGVRFLLGARLQAFERRGSERIARYDRDGQQERVPADEILVAAGRTPNVEGLGLERAGVGHDAAGVKVDNRLRTTNRRIFAIGDVCSTHRFTHAADAQARLVVANALFFGRGRTSALVMPWCTYTSPEIAHVGLYEKGAHDAGIAIDTLTLSLAELDRAVLDAAPEGFLRLHLKKGTDRILGATLVAEHAGEMLGELALAIGARVGLGRIGAVIHPYPTQAEIVRKAADAWRRRKLTPTIRRILGLFFQIVR